MFLAGHSAICIALHCIALHCIALHGIALHCSGFRFTSLLGVLTLLKWNADAHRLHARRSMILARIRQVNRSGRFTRFPYGLSNPHCCMCSWLTACLLEPSSIVWTKESCSMSLTRTGFTLSPLTSKGCAQVSTVHYPIFRPRPMSRYLHVKAFALAGKHFGEEYVQKLAAEAQQLGHEVLKFHNDGLQASMHRLCKVPTSA